MQQVTEFPAPDGDTVIGDIVHTNEHPILDSPPTPADTVHVVVNITYARDGDQPRPIRVDSPGGPPLYLAAAQAHQLATDLATAADQVAVIRALTGADQ